MVLELILAFASLFNFVLGFLVYKSDSKNKINFWYGLFGVVTGFWVLGNLLTGFLYNPFWIKLVYAIAALDVTIFLIWILYFCGEQIKKSVMLIFWMIAALFFITPFSTTLFLENIRRIYLGNVDADHGPLFALYSAYTIGVFSFVVYKLILRYIKSEDVKKLQVRFILIGAFLCMLTVSIVDFLLPAFGVSDYIALDSPSSVFFLIFTTYAITQHHLFNIKVIATELFTFVIGLVLLINVSFSNTLQDLLINCVVFITVIIAGILLIRSVIKEIKQKEEMAKMAEDVRRAYVVEKKAKEDIDKAYNVEKHAKEELEKLDKIKNQFLAQTQHDLRTPLGIIRDYCDLLLSGTFGKQTKKAQDVVKRIQAVSVNKIKDVNNFLDTTQFQLGKKVVSLTPGVKLNPILDEIVGELKNGAQTKGIYLKMEVPEKEFTVQADREKLKSALFNIVDNSIKYTLTGGVTIKLESHDTIHIIVSDTGIGIPKEKVATLFDTAFERSEDAKKASPTGRGIGLYLSSQIIKAHNGKVWVQSEGQGKGSAFHIELPVH